MPCEDRLFKEEMLYHIEYVGVNGKAGCYSIWNGDDFAPLKAIPLSDGCIVPGESIRGRVDILSIREVEKRRISG